MGPLTEGERNMQVDGSCIAFHLDEGWRVSLSSSEMPVSWELEMPLAQFARLVAEVESHVGGRCWLTALSQARQEQDDRRWPE